VDDRHKGLLSPPPQKKKNGPLHADELAVSRVQTHLMTAKVGMVAFVVGVVVGVVGDVEQGQLDAIVDLQRGALDAEVELKFRLKTIKKAGDRCYDLKNFFAEKNGERNLLIMTQNILCQHLIITLVLKKSAKNWSNLPKIVIIKLTSGTNRVPTFVKM
jgi:hypothetical protein